MFFILKLPFQIHQFIKQIRILLFTTLILISCKEKKKTNNEISINPLLSEWKTPFGMPPFDEISSADYLPALRKAITIHKDEIKIIVENKERATFKNTIEALEISGAVLKNNQCFLCCKCS